GTRYEQREDQVDLYGFDRLKEQEQKRCRQNRKAEPCTRLENGGNQNDDDKCCNLHNTPAFPIASPAEVSLKFLFYSSSSSASSLNPSIIVSSSTSIRIQR